jgi:hypothetical protein
MSIYRCNNCGFVCEDQLAVAGAKVSCEKCGISNVYFATAFYVQKLVERYLAARRELEALQQMAESPDAEVPTSSAVVPESALKLRFHDDLQNTSVLATAAQHQPLQDWFASKHIKASFDFSLVDTTGFFDEMAKEIGDHYEILSGPIEQVRYAYRRGFSWLNLDLSEKSPEDSQAINAFFRRLYSHTFFSHYAYRKQHKMLGLAMQPAQAVRSFFEGGWLEWYAFMCLLSRCVERGREFSCARSVKIEFQNEEMRELDVAFLLDARFPIFIECKSGEFRGDLEKYVKLRRYLGIDRSQFIICSTELNVEQVAGLTAMYGLTFVNLDTLKTHIQAVV